MVARFGYPRRVPTPDARSTTTNPIHSTTLRLVAAALLAIASGCGDSEEACGSRADCAEGEVCSAGACVEEPGCRDDVDCPGADVCDDGACVAGELDVSGRFPTGLPPGYELVDLGEVEVLDGETPDLSFDVGPEVRAFFLVGVGKRGSFVLPLSLTAPDGTPFVEPERDAPPAVASYFADFPGPSLSPNRVTGRPRASATLVPNTPALTISPGTWSARFASVRLTIDAANQSQAVPVDGVLRAAVVKRTVDAPTAGTLDVVLSFHASSGLSAATAVDDFGVRQALERLEIALGSVGVELGEVSYRDTAADLPSPLDLGDGSCLGGEVSEVFDRVEPAPGAVHLVFVDVFTCQRSGIDIGANIAGLSNGIPGLPFATRDGVLVATSLKDEFPEDWSAVVAHEVGHYLGLVHTEEAIPGIYDNIPDTADELASDYMMYFNVSASGGSTLVSEDQGWVLRQHPLVRPTVP
jgi:hypothetical protein